MVHSALGGGTGDLVFKDYPMSLSSCNISRYHRMNCLRPALASKMMGKLLWIRSRVAEIRCFARSCVKIYKGLANFIGLSQFYFSFLKKFNWLHFYD